MTIARQLGHITGLMRKTAQNPPLDVPAGPPAAVFPRGGLGKELPRTTTSHPRRAVGRETPGSPWRKAWNTAKNYGRFALDSVGKERALQRKAKNEFGVQNFGSDPELTPFQQRGQWFRDNPPSGFRTDSDAPPNPYQYEDWLRQRNELNDANPS